MNKEIKRFAIAIEGKFVGQNTANIHLPLLQKEDIKFILGAYPKSTYKNRKVFTVILKENKTIKELKK